MPADERPAFLDRACAGDRSLRDEVDRLLLADALPPSVLDRSGLEHLDRLLDGELQGERIGPFRVIRRLGAGGMGTVYLAARAEGEFDQQVAIKLIKRGMDSEEILDRFFGERRILAQLEHPNIARLIDGGVTESGQPYFAMEYVDGMPITEYCDQQNLSIDRRLALFVTVCGAVQYAHQNLVVHRDLKPGNILITRDGVVKLLDFGIAKLLDTSDDPSARTGLTHTGMRVMTPAYASPEQLRGDPVTTASDVYSLGVLLFELLTGERPQGQGPPADSDTAANTPTTASVRPSQMISMRTRARGEDLENFDRICRARGADPSRLRRRLRGDLDTICMMALRPERERRYPSAGELGDDVKRHAERLPVHAQPDTLAYRTRKFVSRYRAAVAVAAAFVAITVALSVVYALRLADERDRARAEAEKARQVTGFLTSLFEAADPNVSKGADLTVKELLDKGRERVSEELSGQPEIQAATIGVIATSYHELGDLETARTLLEQSLNMLVSLHGWEHPEVAAGLNKLGTLLYDLAEYDSSVACDRRALAVARGLYGERDSTVGIYLADLAASVRHQGKLDTAEVMFREALTMLIELLGHEHEDVANTQVHLGRLLQIEGKLDEAEPLLREALATHRKVLGEADFATIANSGALAIVLREKGDFDEAIELRRATIPNMRALVGEDHHFVGALLGSLGWVLLDAGRLAEADSLFREAIANHERTLPEGHINQAIARLGLGSTLMALNRPDEAEPYLRRALEVRRNGLGEAHYQTAEAMSVLGECLRMCGRSQEAESLLVAALKTLQTTLGDDHKLTRITRDRLSKLQKGFES